MGASAQPSGGQNSQSFRHRCQSYTGSYRTANGSVSQAFWWPKELALQPQMPELYRRLLGQQLERRHSPRLLMAKWPSAGKKGQSMPSDGQMAIPSATDIRVIQAATRPPAGKKIQPCLLVAKTASPSATEGIGIKIANWTIAGRDSTAFFLMANRQFVQWKK
jgi:hypothetical protein